MVSRARDGSVMAGSAALLGLFGLNDPTPEQEAGAVLLAAALRDLQTLVRQGPKV